MSRLEDLEGVPEAYKENQTKFEVLNMYKMTDTSNFPLHITPFQSRELSL